MSSLILPFKEEERMVVGGGFAGRNRKYIRAGNKKFFYQLGNEKEKMIAIRKAMRYLKEGLINEPPGN